jgi:subtilisin family serine protease
MIHASFGSRSAVALFAAGVALSLLSISALEPAGAEVALASKLDPRALEVAESSGTAPVFVMLSEQADLAGAEYAADKATRIRYVSERLHEVADRTQPPLVEWLAEQGVAADRYHIVNALKVEADGPTLQALAKRADVANVELEGEVFVPDPGVDVNGDGGSSPDAEAPLVVERGLKAIGADKVWAMGYRGEGVIVGIVDTGANDRHPALKSNYRGRDGDHDYDWLDPAGGSDKPADDDGHGTHVTGISVGEAGARQIGAAPGAEWIACRNIQRRSGEDQNSIECLQWMREPTKLDGSDRRAEMAPDVINASWGSRPGQQCEGGSALRQAVSTLRSDGILFVAAAGNSGDKCETVCAPGSFPDTFTVANYDVRRRGIYSSSSRGPVKMYSDLGEFIKPDIAAPGTNVNSSVPPTRYDTKSGTSMASPHVAGAVALLLSARPELKGRPDVVRQIMEETADEIRADKCGPSGADEFNNAAGHGLMDIEAAVELALSATPPPSPTPEPTITLTPTIGPTATPTLTPEPPTETPPPVFEVYVPHVSRRALIRR